MAGLFALMYGLFTSGSLLINKANEDFETQNNKEIASYKNDLTYWGGDNTRYFTKGDIPCRESLIGNHRVLIGIKGKYKDKIIYDYTQNEENLKIKEFEQKIKEANIKGEEFVTNTNYIVNNCGLFYISGYEIETNRKYIIYKIADYFYLRYLKDKPKQVFQQDKYVELYSFDENYKRKVISKEEYYKRAGYKF